ncbi:MAG TPA: nuclear transport factor 2 family protein [Burkholderiales bacterium]
MRPLAVLALALPLAAQAAEVTVIRPSAFIGADAVYHIALDGRPLRDIETRQHVRFDVPDGRHVLAVRCPKPMNLEYAETRIEEQLGPAPAFFVIEPKFDCVTLTRIDARAAAPLLGNTRLRTDTSTRYEAGKVRPSAALETASPPAPAAADGAASPGAASPSAAWVEAFNSRDPARIAALYDSHAVLIGADAARPAVGRAAIAAYYAGVAGRPMDRVALGEHQVRVYGDWAIDSGLCNFFEVRDGRSSVSAARYTLVWRRRDRRWLIVEHHSSRVP